MTTYHTVSWVRSRVVLENSRGGKNLLGNYADVNSKKKIIFPVCISLLFIFCLFVYFFLLYGWLSCFFWKSFSNYGHELHRQSHKDFQCRDISIKNIKEHCVWLHGCRLSIYNDYHTNTCNTISWISFKTGAVEPSISVGTICFGMTVMRGICAFINICRQGNVISSCTQTITFWEL